MAEAPEGAPLALVGVERHYSQGDAKLHILTGADLVLASGEMVALVAPSGAGKSTLLHIAGLLERPDGGDVIVDNLSSAELDDAARTRIRREAIGFVYQSHYLLGGILRPRECHAAPDDQGAAARRSPHASL